MKGSRQPGEEKNETRRMYLHIIRQVPTYFTSYTYILHKVPTDNKSWHQFTYFLFPLEYSQHDSNMTKNSLPKIIPLQYQIRHIR